MVRIPLAGRRVAGWVVEIDPQTPVGTELSEVAKISGIGPDAAMIDLCRWVAWRWAGRLATILRVASPDRMVPADPPVSVRPARPAIDRCGTDPGSTCSRSRPPTTPSGCAVAAATLGQALIVTTFGPGRATGSSGS